MDIIEITDHLNEIAAQSQILSVFQSSRAERLNYDRPRTYKLFSASTVFNGEDIYAFHDGGRNELQLNIGVEELNGQEMFRYGLGFSLEANQSQPDPINFFSPKIFAFNEYHLEDPTFFKGLSIWHYKEDGIIGRSKDYKFSVIPKEWIEWGNFIAIGKYFKKSIDEITLNDLSAIIRLFERLIPVYEFVEKNYTKYALETQGDRISRVCWNEFDWMMPSGRKGKSTDKSTHEGKYGYGHEEWLGDTSKLIDGFHYGFLETIRKYQDTYAGKKFNIDLFAINNENGARRLVGNMQDVEVIDNDKAKSVKKIYVKNGWLAEMEQQIIEAGANNEGFSDWQGVDLFNIRYKPENIQFYSDYIDVSNDPKIEDIQRYSFAHKTAVIQTNIPLDNPFVFNPVEPEDTSGEELEKSGYERVAKPVEIVYLHKQLRDALHKYFFNAGGKDVSIENPTGKGTLVDIARKENGKMIFYEIKTYNNLKSCIREAMGQILEYAYWPMEENAQELIIVSHHPINDDAKNYLKGLRKKFKLPVFYQHFDIGNKILSEKY